MDETCVGWKQRAVALTLATVVLLAAGCGDDAPQDPAALTATAGAREPEPTAALPTPTPPPLRPAKVTVKDAAGDAEDGNYVKYADRGDLDLRSVVVERTGGAIRVLFETAAPPSNGTIYSFFYFALSGDGGGLIQVRKRPDGTLTADASVSPSPTVTQLPSDLVRLESAALAVTIPPEDFDDLDRFTWWASVATIGAAVEISDEVPNQADVLNPTTAAFPA